jgi:hypothetical protein
VVDKFTVYVQVISDKSLVASRSSVAREKGFIVGKRKVLTENGDFLW